MCDLDHFVGKDFNDLCLPTGGLRGRKVAALKVGMPVKMITWLGNPDEPVDGFEPLMRLRVFIMNSKRRRVRDEYVERTTIVHFVQEQAR